MEITLDEGLLHLSKWRDEKVPILAQHGTREWQNHTLIMCHVSDLNGRLTLTNEDDPGQFTGTYAFEMATWLYLEVWELKDYPESLRSVYRKDTPVLVLGWPDMEILILQPLPDELQSVERNTNG